jgi:peptide/nickel transport system substrate-binding protein
VKNPDYFKKGLPYLDGIEYTILPNRSTAILGFVAGKFDITFPTEVSIPLLKDVKSQAPNAVCVLEQTNVATNLIINRESPPFDNAEVRRAVALSLDRKSFVSIMFEGNSDLGGAMLPPPNGVWGLPPEELKTVIGYGEDVKANRDEARKLMEKAGFGPNKRLALKVSTRNLAVYRDPAVILIDQLKDIYIDGELDVIESGIWFAKVARKEYQVGLNLTGAGIDDPDQTSTKTSAAARSATTPTTATATCRSSSTRSRSRPMWPSARSSYGRSTRSCRRTWRGRSFITRDKGPAGSLT